MATRFSRAMKSSMRRKSSRVGPPPCSPMPQNTGTSRLSLSANSDPLLQAFRNVVPLSVIQPHHNPKGQDFRAVQSAPAIQVGRQVQLMCLRAQVNIHLESSLSQQLGQPSAVSEAVEVVGHLGFNPEVLAEEAPPDGHVADQRFGARKVHVRLQVPSPANGPASRGNQFLDLAEQAGGVVLHPAIKQSFIVIEDQGGMLLEQLDGGGKSGERLGAAFLPSSLLGGSRLRPFARLHVCPNRPSQVVSGSSWDQPSPLNGHSR